MFKQSIFSLQFSIEIIKCYIKSAKEVFCIFIHKSDLVPLCNNMSIYFCKTKVAIVTCHGPAIVLLYDKENRNSRGGGARE